MPDKVFGTDYDNEVTPTGVMTISVNNGTTLKDVELQNLHKALTQATESQAGTVELSTDAEAQTGTDTARAITPANLQAVTSTETRKGVIELATSDEVLAGTDTTRAVTPDTLNDIVTRIPFEGQMLNGKIFASVASNNLTVGIKTLSGNDPSSSDPVYANINGTTRSITSGLNITLTAGSNYFNAGSTELATQEIDYFVYLIWKSGSSSVAVGFSRIPYGNLFSDFSSTSTHERYLANAGGLSLSDAVVVVGRFAATLSAGAGYTWTVPTFTAANMIQRPIFESRWLTWAEQYTGFSSSPSMLCFYKVLYDECHVNTFLQANGTSNATTASMTLPFANAVSHALVAWAGVTDNGTLQTTPGHARTSAANSNVLDIYKTFFSGAWTAAGAKGWNFPNFFYRIR